MDLISIITTTYNRAHVLGRAIKSVMEQTYKDWELIIVDDGSTDDTQTFLMNFADEKRIKVIKHEINKGVTATKNTGLNHINGIWFTFLDSDDELFPNALEEMYRVISKNPSISAVTSNCLDSTTQMLTGKGPTSDRFLSFQEVVKECRGEFWGITKTELLGDMRFNENISGEENILWYRIDEKANRFYIHKPLRIYHTEGQDRMMRSNQRLDFEKKYMYLSALFSENEYVMILTKHDVTQFKILLLKYALFCYVCNHKAESKKAIERMERQEWTLGILMTKTSWFFGSHFLKEIIKLIYRFKNLRLLISFKQMKQKSVG